MIPRPAFAPGKAAKRALCTIGLATGWMLVPGCTVSGTARENAGATTPDRVRVLSSFGASGPRRTRPAFLRFEIRSTSWAGEPNLPFVRTDTMDVRVRPGDDLDGPREYHGMDFPRGAPFVLGAIVDPQNAWVRFTRDVVPVVRWEGDAPADSILVSTVWRSFHTPSMDAGTDFQIRIAWTDFRAGGMQVFRRPPSRAGGRSVLGQGVVAGSLRRADTGGPVGGAEVTLQGFPRRTVSSATGRFELAGVPIGHWLLLVRDRCGEAHAAVEVSDERTEELDVVLSCVDPLPATMAPAPARTGAARSPGAGGPAWPARRVDVWPLPMIQEAPAYPPEARRRGFEGDVRVHVWIDSLGLVRDARIETSVFPEVDASAEECVRKWRFRPALENGRPVPSTPLLRVHFAHPRSPELVPVADRRSVAETPVLGRRARSTVAVEVSARLDSVTGLYRYAYRVENHSRSEFLAAFGLMPVASEIEDLAAPEGWNSFVGCGGRNDVIGCMAWGDDRATVRDQTFRPGEALEGFAFESRHPPARIRWFAQTMGPDYVGPIPWMCMQGDPSAMVDAPPQGVTFGPQPRRGTSP